jgi:hypothetical protein
MAALSHKSEGYRFLRKDHDGFPDACNRAYRDTTASALAEAGEIEITSGFEGLEMPASLLAASDSRLT